MSLSSNARTQNKYKNVNDESITEAHSTSATGTGLCAASNVWTKTKGELPQTRDSYPGQINIYMEEDAQRMSRVTSVFRHAFDL